jgi:hypothetical protein
MDAPKRFTKKPVEVEALQWTGDNIDAVARFVTHRNFNMADDELEIYNRLEKRVSEEGCYIPCPVGHWIIKGIKGEFYPCESEVFAATYEQAAASVS